MFFFFSKALIFFTKPFVIIVGCFILTYFIRSTLWKKRLRWASLVLFLFFSNGVIFNELLRWWEVPPVAISDLGHDYKAAIVLGGTADVEREPHDRLFLKEGAGRITHAVHLYKAGIIDKVIYTGGRSKLFEDATVDNQPILLFYTDCGIPEHDIILESSSRNTHENAAFTAAITDASEKYILITSAFHMRRAYACFKKEGIDVTPFSCNFGASREDERFEFSRFLPSLHVLNMWDRLIKEWLGMTFYKLAGYI